MKKNIPTIDLHEIRRKSITGVIALTSRSFMMSGISVVGFGILSAILDKEAFGIFGLASAAINFLNYFSDIGLAGALIQKKEEPTRDDLVTTFTLQQILVLSVVGIALLFSQTLAHFYKLPPAGLFLMRALAVSFIFSSLKTIPSILLERKLDFTNLVKPQIAETFVYYLVVIVLAFKGFGVASYAWATLFRGIVGVIVVYMIAPWKPGLYINRTNARKLLSFGIHFQAPSFLALIKDDLIFLLLGKILPLGQLGYITWAKKIVDMILRQQIMDNVVRITFPAFSRIQHDLKLLARGIRRTLLFLALLSFPASIGLVTLARSVIFAIPRFGQWEGALSTLYLLTLAFMMAMFSTPFYNALNALGMVKSTLKLMILRTVLTWLTVPLFVHLWGYIGFAIAMVVINLTSFIPLFILRKLVPFGIFDVLVRPFLASVIMGFIVLLLTLTIRDPRLQIAVGTLIGGLVYGGIIYVVMGKDLLSYGKMVLQKKVA